MDFLTFTLVPVVALVTYYLSQLQFVGAIRASAIIGLIIYFFAAVLAPAPTIIFYGATFVGMCSRVKFSSFDIFMSSVLYYFIVSSMTEWFKGIGGTLGISAFLGVLIWMGIKQVSKSLRSK